MSSRPNLSFGNDDSMPGPHHQQVSPKEPLLAKVPSGERGDDHYGCCKTGKGRLVAVAKHPQKQGECSKGTLGDQEALTLRAALRFRLV